MLLDGRERFIVFPPFFLRLKMKKRQEMKGSVSVNCQRRAPSVAHKTFKCLLTDWRTASQLKTNAKAMRQGHAIFEPIDHLLCSYSFFKAQLFSKGKTNLMARIRRIEREFTPNLRTLTSCREERKRKTIDLLTTPTLEPFLFDKLLSQKTIRFQVISEKEEEKSKLGWLCRDEI